MLTVTEKVDKEREERGSKPSHPASATPQKPPISICFRPECLAEATAIALVRERGAARSGAIRAEYRHGRELRGEKSQIRRRKKTSANKRSSSCVLFCLLEGGASSKLLLSSTPFASLSLLFPLFPSLALSFTQLFSPPLPTLSGRVDATKELDDFSLTASLTDATAKDLDNAPHLRDALITARTKKDGTNLMVGYDAGQRGALAGLTTATELAGKAVDLGATWFQNGNHVRGEARVQIDDSQSLWATKTLNDDNDVGNATVVNLAERKAFVIEPFNIPVSTAAVKYIDRARGLHRRARLRPQHQG